MAGRIASRRSSRVTRRRLLLGSTALLAWASPAVRAADIVVTNGQTLAPVTLTTSEAVRVGAGSSGTLNLATGSLLTIDTTHGSTAGRLELGDGGSGILNLSGGTIRFNIAASPSAGSTAVGRLWVGGGPTNTTGGTGIVTMTGGLIDYVELDPATRNYGGLAIGRGLGVVGTFNQSGGTVRIGSTVAIDIGTEGGTGSYRLSGDAALDVSDGGGTLYVGSRTDANGVASTGTLRISDNASITMITGSNSGGQFFVGDARATGSIIQDGAGSVVTFRQRDPMLFGANVGNKGGANGGGTGSYTLSAGTLNVLNPGGSAAIRFGAAAGGRGEFLISGGTANIATNLSIGYDAGSTGLLRQTGGTLSLTGSSRLQVRSGTGSYELLGGRLLIGGTEGLYGGGTLSLGSATLGVQGSNFSYAGTATLASGSTFTVDTQGLNATLSGDLSGAGGLTKAGLGTLTLGGANSYTGLTTIGGGTLALTGAGSIASSAGLVNNGILDISGITLGTTLANLSGNGRIDLGLRSLAVGTDNSSTAFSGTIANGGFNWDATYGVFAKVGTGTLTIDGATISGGEAHVRGGKLAQTGGTTSLGYIAVGTGQTGGVGNVGGLDISGGAMTIGTTLQLGDFRGVGTLNQTGGTITVDQLCGSSSHCAAVNIGNQGGTGTYNISGGSLLLPRASLALGRNTAANPAGSGTLNLSGTGLVDLTDGRFNIGNWLSVGAGIPRSSGTLNQSGGTLRIRSAGQLFLSGSGNGIYNLTGGALEIGGTSLRANYGSGTGTYAFNLGGGTIRAIGSAMTAPVAATLLSGTQSTIDTNALGATWSGVLSGSGGLAKAGAGTLTLSGANSYTGATTISTGTLALSGAGTIAASSGLANDGVFDISATTSGTSLANLSGSGRVDTGLRVLRVGTDNSSTTFSGTIVNGGLGWLASYGSFDKVGTGTLTLNGATISGGENHILGGAIAQSAGQTNINHLSVGTGTVGGVANVGALNVSGGSLTFGTGLQVGDFGGSGTVNQTGGSIVIQPGCGDASRCALFNIGNQGGTGVYNISGGSLTLTSGSFGLGRNTSNNPASSGTLNLSGTGLVDLTAGFFTIGNWMVVNGTTQRGSGVINQTGGIFRIGNATNLYLSGSGNGIYNLLGGALEIGGTSLNANYNNNGGTHQLNLGGGTLRVSDTALTSTVPATLLTGTQSTIDSNALGVTWSGVLSGDGGLAKAGAGTLSLTNANSYSGGTTISAGTLQIGTGSTSGSIVGNVVNNATLAFNRSNALAFGGAISGSGALSKLGASTLTLTGANSFTGATTVAAGTLALSGAGRVTGAVVNDATFDISATTGNDVAIGGLSGSGTVMLGARTLGLTGGGIFGGVISGSGGLRLSSGTQILTGANDYSGGTAIAGGTLQLGTGGILLGNVANDGVLAFDRSDDVSFGGTISGSGALLKSGTNRLTLTASNSFAGTTTIAGGTLALTGAGRIVGNVAATGIFDISATTGSNVSIGGLSGTGSVALGTRALSLTGAGGSFAGSITGTGGLTLLGGTQTLTGSNDYSGGTTITAGTLRIGAGGTTGSISGNVTISSELVFDRSDDVSYVGVLIGSGGLTKAGAGTLTLTAVNSYSGGTTIAGGTLALTGAGRIAGDVVDNGALVFNTADNLSFGGAISGTGSLTQAGSGTLTLTGNGSYSGGTTIAAGTLALSGAGRIIGALVNNGSFDVSAASGPISLSRLTGSGNVALGSRNLSISAASGSFSGAISGSGGLTIGGGTQILTGANTYTGGTAISGGIVQIGAGGTSGSVVGNIVNNGTLLFNRSDAITFAGAISGSGSLVKAGAGSLTLSGANSYGGGTNVQSGTLRLTSSGAAGTGRITLESGTTLGYAAGISVANDLRINGLATLEVATGTATQAGALSGSARYILGGAGRLLLTGDNSAFTGSVSVSGLTVDLDRSSALGTGLVDLTGSTTFRYANGVSIANAITLGSGATLAGIVDSGRATQAGAIGGAGAFAKSGAGTLALTGTSSFSGGLLLAGGTLEVSGTPGTGLIDMADGTSLLFTASTTAANRLDISGSATLGVGTGLQATLGGVIGDGTRAGALVKSGAGTLTLTSANRYSGGTSINAGTLRLGAGGSLTGSIANAGILAFDGADRRTIAGAITGSGSLVKAGSGATILTANNNYEGGTTIAAGSLQIGAGGTSGAITGNVVNNGALAFNRADAVTFAGAISGSGSLTHAGGGTLTLAGANSYSGGTTIGGGTLHVTGALTGNVVNGGTLTFDRAEAAAFGGVISGSGSLVKTGAGTLTLSAANSYADGTTVQTGTLLLGNDRAAGLGRIILEGGTTLGYANGITVANDLLINGEAHLDVANGVATQAGAITGTGRYVLSGAGRLMITGDNSSFTGPVTISGVNLDLESSNALGAGDVEVAESATLTYGDGLEVANNVSLGATATLAAVVDEGRAAVQSGAITGDGAVAKTGTGTMILTGDNSYTGGTTITGGVLQVGNGGTSGAISGNVDNSGTLAFNRTDTLVFSGSISGSGGIVQASGGTLVLTGANSFSGGTTISSGTLALSGDGRISGPVVTNGVFDIAATTGGAVQIAGLTGQGSVSLGSQTLALGGANGSFAGTITGSGGVVLTSGTQVLTGTNSHSGGTTIAGGTLMATAAALGTGPIVGNGALVIEQATDARLANPVSGTGSLVKSGTAKLELTGTSNFSGETHLTGGRLAVNGALPNSVVTADSGTTLSGAGTVGGVSMSGGAAVAPGNSIGTLTVSGNVVQAAGSTYEVEVDPASDRSDRIVAQGSATIAPGAILHVIKETDIAYAPGRIYTVLTAAGGVTGRYTVTGDTAISAFYALVDRYAAQSVTLEAAQVRTFASAGVTANQIAVADGLDSLAAGNRIHDIVAMYADDAPARSAFDQLSGEIAASAHSALIESRRFAREAVIDQLRLSGDEGRAVWGRLFGSSGDLGRDAALDFSARGLIAGADITAGNGARIGFYAAGSRTRFSVDDRSSTGASDDRELGFYAGGRWGGLGLRAGAGYTWHDIDSTRRIAIPGFADRQTRDADAQTLQGFAEAGYRFGTELSSAEPFAGIAYVDLNEKASREQGAASLDNAGTTSRATFSTLGLRGQWLQQGPMSAVGFAGSVAWRHGFGDLTPSARLAFGGGDRFTVGGVALARDAAVIEAGVHMQITPSLSWNVDYAGQLGRDFRDHGLRGTLGWRF
ncbi:autotransporter-associated beta strand repeat-containing protein [Sphingoaurantiacus capsulatus]|uniref:Autotransporter-associated beta strand repeat-containing protein n=1 Tax=Sphingoaurantiacus capsulatus TaxID=1771310 RepID=A0ABV7XA32_9SPHN